MLSRNVATYYPFDRGAVFKTSTLSSSKLHRLSKDPCVKIVVNWGREQCQGLEKKQRILLY